MVGFACRIAARTMAGIGHASKLSPYSSIPWANLVGRLVAAEGAVARFASGLRYFTTTSERRSLRSTSCPLTYGRWSSENRIALFTRACAGSLTPSLPPRLLAHLSGPVRTGTISRTRHETMERDEVLRLRPGESVLYVENIRQGGFDQRTHEAMVRKVGTRRVKVAFDGKEAWVKPWRIRQRSKASS